MNVKKYIIRLIFPVIASCLYFILLKEYQLESFSVFIHWGFYASMMFYLFKLGELTSLYHQLKEEIHYFSFLKNVVLTIIGSMILGFLYNAIIISTIPSVVISRGYLIPVGNLEYMIYWLIVMGVIKPIVDTLLFHRLMIVCDNKTMTVVTLFISLFAQAIMGMGSMSGGLALMILSLPPTLMYIYKKDISVSFMAQFLVNLASCIAIFYNFC